MKTKALLGVLPLLSCTVAAELSPPVKNKHVQTHHQHNAHQVNVSADLRPPILGKLSSIASMEMMTLGNCRISDFENLSGGALINKIKSVKNSCINQLFSASLSQSKAIFSENQMLSVADTVARLSSGYQGDNKDKLLQAVLFLRAGYYAQWGHQDHIDKYSSHLQQQVAKAIDTFINNRNFNNISNEHGEILSEIIILMDSAELNAKYVETLQRMLDKFNYQHTKYRDMVVALNSVFTVLFRGHQFDDFKTKVKNYPQIVTALDNFTKKQADLLGTDSQYVLSNSVRELGRFLQYEGELKNKAKQGVKRILSQYNETGKGAALWMGAAEMVNHYDEKNCEEYDICGFKDRVKNRVLSIKHQCNDAISIRAQQLSSKELTGICQVLAEQSSYFHKKLNTNYTPVEGDNNTSIEVVAFDSRDDYVTYAGVLFDMDTNNGGMYLEGDPADPNNQARFIAYEQGGSVWNLRHEFVHYLDGRFDMKGGFNDYPLSTTVWWIEGLGEYIAKKDVNPEAIRIAKTKALHLGEIFSNDYSKSVDRIYRWGYLAVRFMHEKHSGDVHKMTSYFRKGEYKSYEEYLNGMRNSYNQEFHRWLDELKDGKPDPKPNPNPTPDPDPKPTPDPDPKPTPDPKPNPNPTPNPNPDDGDCKGNTSTDRDDELILGQSKQGISGDENKYYFVYLPDCAKQLSVKLSGGNGDANLYLKKDDWPSSSEYDQLSKQPGNNEIITLQAPTAGYYHLMIEAAQAYQEASVIASTGSISDTKPKPPQDCEESASGRDDELDSCKPKIISGGTPTYFYIYVPSGTKQLQLSTSGGEGNVDIYANNEGWPTTSEYQYSSTNHGTFEQIVIDAPKENHYYHILVQPKDTYKGVTLKGQLVK